MQLESMPPGRPKKLRDQKTFDQIVELFEKHLTPGRGAAARRANLFNYPVGSETVHKAKLLKRLALVHALCALTGRKPSGPLQVKALQIWNQKNDYVPRNGSKTWADDEIQRLYHMQIDLCNVSDLGEKEWAELVGDVETYPRLNLKPMRRIRQKRHEDQTLSEEAKDESGLMSASETDASEEETKGGATRLPSYMFQQMQEMGVTLKWEDDSETNTAESAKGNGVLPLLSEPGIVRQRCRSAASSTEPALNSPPWAETCTEKDSYMTPAQILKEECDDEANTQAKIKYAESLGEGVDEDGKRRGWYHCETINAPVYYYAKNMAHAVKLRDDEKQMTKQSTKTSPEALAAHAREACMISTSETLRIDDSCPCYTDTENNPVYGTFIDRPSDQGMAQAEFTGSAGTKLIVELPFLTYKEYKDQHAVYCKPKRGRRSKKLKQRRSKKLKPVKNRKVKVLKKAKAISNKAGKVTQKAPQKGKKGDTKPYRPDQYYLLKRPADISVDQARADWRAMSPNDKKQFGHDTWEERQARTR